MNAVFNLLIQSAFVFNIFAVEVPEFIIEISPEEISLYPEDLGHSEQNGVSTALLQKKETGWDWANIDDLNFKGVWNALTNTPDLHLLRDSLNPGDFYIIVNASADPVNNFDLDGESDWSIRDWVVLNPEGEWEKISAQFFSREVNGQSGDVIINGIDFLLEDLFDVDISPSSPPQDGNILKFDGGRWYAGEDLFHTPSGSRVTEINTGTGLIGGPITVSGTISLAPAGIGPTEIAAGAVSGDHFADHAIDTTKIANNAVTGEKMANTILNASHFANETLTGRELANNSIGTGKIVNREILNRHIQNNAIEERHFANLSITNAHIADNAVTSFSLADGAIIANRIANGSISSGAKFSDNLSIGKLSTSGTPNSGNTLRGNGSWGEVPLGASQTCTAGPALIAGTPPAISESYCRYQKIGDSVHFSFYARVAGVGQNLTQIRFPFAVTTGPGVLGAACPLNRTTMMRSHCVIRRTNGTQQIYRFVTTRTLSNSVPPMLPGCSTSYSTHFFDEADHWDASTSFTLAGGGVYEIYFSGVAPAEAMWEAL